MVPPPGIEPGPSGLQPDAQTLCARAGNLGDAWLRPRLVDYSLVKDFGIRRQCRRVGNLREGKAPPDRRAARPGFETLLEHARRAHRSARFGTQDSNPELAVQSRSSFH